MKKVLFCIVMLIVPLMASADAIKINGIYYNLSSSSPYKAEVTRNTSDSYTGDITIPSTVKYGGKTYDVTSIGYYTFGGCSGLTSITIPNSITSIGEYAFCNCDNLTEIQIPNSVTSLGARAFQDCYGLISATIGHGVSRILAETFDFCSHLRSITLGRKVSSLEVDAFSRCYDLRDVYYCAETPPVTDQYAFDGIPLGGINLHVPAGSVAAYQAAYIWKDFQSISAITVSTGEFEIGGIKYRLSDTQTAEVIRKWPSYTGDVMIPSSVNYHGVDYSVTSIEGSAFSQSSITSVVIPTSVTVIGSWAFQSCSKLTSVIIPEGVTIIKANTFGICTKLTSVTIPSSVQYIEDGSFSNLENLTDVYCYAESVPTLCADAFEDTPTYKVLLHVPSGAINKYKNESPWNEFKDIVAIVVKDLITFADTNVEAICVQNWDTDGDGGLSKEEAAAVTNLGSVFSSNNSITSFNELQYFTGVTSIGDNAFEGCSSLTSITIPNSVKSIGRWAFSGCSSLTSLTIPSSVTSIDMDAFRNCIGLTSITIPNSVTSLGGESFCGCSGLTHVTISNSLTTIGVWTFKGCSNLASIEIPNSITSIGNEAFAGCKSLTSITIPNSVISIGDEAFYKCSGLTSIVLSNSLTSIGSSAFSGCSGLTSITVPNSVTSIGSSVFGNCTGLISIKIPNSVTSIGDYTFSGCSGLTSVEIPNTVTTIGQKAFYHCSSLTSIVIPNYVTSIESSTFEGCSSLSSVTIPNSVTKIGGVAFYNCTSLTSIEIPNSVTKIGTYAFGECTGLSEIHCQIETPFAINNDVFWSAYGSGGYQIYNNAKLYVPFGTANAYKATDGWKNFQNILEMADASPITITAENKTIEYGEALPEFTFKSEGGELSGTPTITCEATSTSPVGNYPITVSKGTVENIHVTYVAGTLTINKAPLTVTAKSYTIKQGDPLPTFEATITGFKNSETSSVLTTQPTISCTATSASALGTYDINVSSAAGTNYSFTYVKGTLTITAADPVTVTASSYTIAYGDPLPNFGYAVTGATLSGTPTISCSATTTSPVGTYPITISKGSVTNYNDTYVNGTLTISKAPLTVTAKSYTIKQGDPLPTFEATYSGFKNSETSSVLTTQPTISCSATSLSAPGNYDIIISGAEAQNYDITYVKGQLTVDVGTFTLTYMVDGEVYKTVNYNYGATITPEAEPTKEGYAFSGWGSIPATMPANNVTVSGTFTKGAYKITYMVDGAVYKTIGYNFGDAITAEAEPTKEGYSFSGWSTIPATMPAQDVTVNGSFTINKYTLTYMVDGAVYKTITCDYGTALTLEAVPTKEGYTFSGWSALPATMPASDVTVSGSFTVNKYQLTYKVDGVVYKTITYNYGASITSEDTPKKEGHTFSGWSTIPTTMPAQDVTVNGTFTINKYKLTYVVDGVEYKSYQIEYGAAITPEAEPTKVGYAFSGWGTIPATMPAKDVTVTGSFSKGAYKLTYIVDGTVYKTIGYDYGATITPEANPTKEGYTFSGWNNLPATMPASDISVTGSFTINEYTITYMVDGAVFKSITLQYGATITPEANPAKEGYTFSGWSWIPTKMPAENVTVTGSFTINKYKLTYMVDGHEYKSVELEFGAAIVPESEPTKEGYSFSGWGAVPETMPARNITVSGTFSKGAYKLTYMVDGAVYKIVSYDFGATVMSEPVPVKEGYTFSGWSEVPATMPANDVTVTGVFTINKYKITYIIDGETYLEEEVEYGSAITPPNAPERDGYQFEWSSIPDTMPAYPVTIYGSYTTGIDIIMAEGSDVKIFTVSGKPLEKLQKGVNIIQFKNGKTKKVMVK